VDHGSKERDLQAALIQILVVIGFLALILAIIAYL
jgi:hypothetical protein